MCRDELKICRIDHDTFRLEMDGKQITISRKDDIPGLGLCFNVIDRLYPVCKSIHGVVCKVCEDMIKNAN